MTKSEYRPGDRLSLKEIEGGWNVEGYPSTWEVDLQNEMVMPGAFRETLRSGPKVRFLLSHEQSMILGVPTELREDEKGLFGAFKISKTQLGADARRLLLDGALDSFSIGYRTEEDDHVWDAVNMVEVRVLKRITLYEVSLVAIPANQGARVTRVKAAAARLVEARLAQFKMSEFRRKHGIDEPVKRDHHQPVYRNGYEVDSIFWRR